MSVHGVWVHTHYPLNHSSLIHNTRKEAHHLLHILAVVCPCFHMCVEVMMIMCECMCVSKRGWKIALPSSSGVTGGVGDRQKS